MLPIQPVVMYIMPILPLMKSACSASCGRQPLAGVDSGGLVHVDQITTTQRLDGFGELKVAVHLSPLHRDPAP